MGYLVNTCPRCKTKLIPLKINYATIIERNSIRAKVETGLSCAHCKKPSWARFSFKCRSDELDKSIISFITDPLSKVDEISEFYSPDTTRTSLNIPESVALYHTQAEQTADAQMWDAAGAMCRKALEVSTRLILKEKGGEAGQKAIEKKLNPRINALYELHLITEELKDWAHQIRLDGNDALHEDEPFSDSQAKDILNFTEIYLRYVHELPLLLESKKQKRTDKASAKPITK